MAKTVMLAVAGAGKTYYICHNIDPTKKNLILAYTHENIHNIQNELCNAYGNIPEFTTVMTFDAFVYHHAILPYEPSIAEHFGCKDFRSRGISIIDPPPPRKDGVNGMKVRNPAYVNKDKLKHYITPKMQYYCATLSELVMQVKNGREKLINRVASRINLFYDCVLIDEFQDFRERDFDLIMALAEKLNNVVLVGDYYQHSVSGTNNSGKPFKNRSNDVSYEEFVSMLKQSGFNVDVNTLDKSRRCSKDICEYVRHKLGINIYSHGDNEGSVIWADDNAAEILDDEQIIKLVFSKAADYRFKAVNWSYSKGDTMNAVCVILTDKFEKLADDTFTIKGISASTINKLYVAMTRSQGNLYLMRSSTFKRLKTDYSMS